MPPPELTANPAKGGGVSLTMTVGGVTEPILKVGPFPLLPMRPTFAQPETKLEKSNAAVKAEKIGEECRIRTSKDFTSRFSHR